MIALTSCGPGLAVVVRPDTDLAIPGWATTAFGASWRSCFQSLMFMLVFSFMILGGRNGVDFLPRRDYAYFVGSDGRLPMMATMATTPTSAPSSTCSPAARNWKSYFRRPDRPLPRQRRAGGRRRPRRHDPRALPGDASVAGSAWSPTRGSPAGSRRSAPASCRPAAGSRSARSTALREARSSTPSSTSTCWSTSRTTAPSWPAPRARLRPGGHVVVLSPAHQWLFTPFDEAIGHHRRYTKATLRRHWPPRASNGPAVLPRLGRHARLAGQSALPPRRDAQPRRSPSGTGSWCRLSRVVDPLLGYSAGKSVLGVWRK